MTSSMESDCLALHDLPHTTKLFSTFIEDFQRVSRYYAHPPTEAGVLAAAREVQLAPETRARVVEVLREQNRRLGADASTDRSIDRLAAGAAAIVTGQQVGLFLGPAYSVYKALSAIRWAEKATARGTEAVPIYWLATEDHDLAEVNHSDWNTREGLARYELPLREEDSGHRVGDVLLGAAVEPLAAKAAESLEGEFAVEVSRALRESYAPGETYGSAFGKLMARILAGRGMIFIDPLDPRLHQLAAGVYLRAAEKADSLRDALLERSNELDRGGFHAQVKVTRETTLLFYNLDGRRQPVRRRNGKFSVGSATFTPDELRAAIDRNPEAFTANVLLRPVVQDTILPTAAYIGGPAEIAYMAQAQVAYQAVLGRMPAMLTRAGFTLVETPISRLLKNYDIEIRDVFRGRQYLRSQMEQKSLPRALERKFAADEKKLKGLLQGYRRPLEHLDRTLLGALESAESKILYQFMKLREKGGRAENLRIGVLDRHERLLLDALCPHREPQERTLSFLPFLAAHGPDLLETLGEHLDLACPHHHVLFL
ncbi:MAG TPA: bacillithiol biosynthesis cysteine-adding enzyme BshC [archaeon]|nr:bacillithiol biosynthesis cysteine-adding enzyme BshC [archaeon]